MRGIRKGIGTERINRIVYDLLERAVHGRCLFFFEEWNYVFIGVEYRQELALAILTKAVRLHCTGAVFVVVFSFKMCKNKINMMQVLKEDNYGVIHGISRKSRIKQVSKQIACSVLDTGKEEDYGKSSYFFSHRI